MRWLADENFDYDILRGLLRRQPELDIIRVQDVGLSGVDDPTILAWAAAENRILITRDVNTMPAHAYRRAANGERMPGVLVVSRSVTVGAAVADILLISECSHLGEWEGQVRYLPLR
ncbi:MAG: DUF5615 family PIN-like protein [Bryobacteraceae bacterium]